MKTTRILYGAALLVIGASWLCVLGVAAWFIAVDPIAPAIGTG